MKKLILVLLFTGCATVSSQPEPVKPTMLWVRPGTDSIDGYVAEFVRDGLQCARETNNLPLGLQQLKTQECMERAGYVRIK